MTRRKQLVLGFVGGQLLLAVLAFVFALIGWQALATVALAGMGLLVSALLAAVWRAVEMKTAATDAHVTKLNRTFKTARASARPQTAQKPKTDDFSVGRSAGARLQVELDELAQSESLFGGRTAWQQASLDATGPVSIAVLGPESLYVGLDPARWRIVGVFGPGMLAAQAEFCEAGLLVCDSRLFSDSTWSGAIDPTGEWLVQDLLQLRGWADRSGATLLLSDHAGLPIGVNTETIEKAFHVALGTHDPETLEGAPLPAVFAPLQQLHHSLATSAMTSSAPEETAR